VSADSQIQKGREALTYFHNVSLTYPAYKKLQFDELLNQVSGGGKKVTIFLEGFGFAIEQINDGYFFSTSRVKQAMESLANEGQGRVPTNNSVFFKALSDEAQNISWSEASKFVAVESAKEIGNGLVEVGNVTLDTLKSLGVVLPLAIVGAVLFIIYSRARKLG
jgi:hypothetical protein